MVSSLRATQDLPIVGSMFKNIAIVPYTSNILQEDIGNGLGLYSRLVGNMGLQEDTLDHNQSSM